MVVSNAFYTIMENEEQILAELTAFEKSSDKRITPLLEEYLICVAKTGKIVLAWSQIKALVVRKMELVILGFMEECPVDDLPKIPNAQCTPCEKMRDDLINTLSSFTSAPFTIQRLCEMLTEPRRNYKRIDKFLRGLEKNILVVTTVSEYSVGRSLDDGDDDCNCSSTSPLLNGDVTRVIDECGGDDDDDEEEEEVEDDDESSPSPTLVLPSAFPVTLSWPAPHENNLPLWSHTHSHTGDVPTSGDVHTSSAGLEGEEEERWAECGDICAALLRECVHMVSEKFEEMSSTIANVMDTSDPPVIPTTSTTLPTSPPHPVIATTTTTTTLYNADDPVGDMDMTEEVDVDAPSSKRLKLLSVDDDSYTSVSKSRPVEQAVNGEEESGTTYQDVDMGDEELERSKSKVTLLLVDGTTVTRDTTGVTISPSSHRDTTDTDATGVS